MIEEFSSKLTRHDQSDRVPQGSHIVYVPGSSPVQSLCSLSEWAVSSIWARPSINSQCSWAWMLDPPECRCCWWATPYPLRAQTIWNLPHPTGGCLTKPLPLARFVLLCSYWDSLLLRMALKYLFVCFECIAEIWCRYKKMTQYKS